MIIRDIDALHPKFSPVVRRLSEFLIAGYKSGATKTLFEVFETFRSPNRQLELFRKGSTKALPWQSAHQFGLAVDFVPVIDRDEAHRLGDMIGEKVLEGWSWHSSHDWTFLKKSAEHHGLTVPIEWDKAHVQFADWWKIRTALNTIIK